MVDSSLAEEGPGCIRKTFDQVVSLLCCLMVSLALIFRIGYKVLIQVNSDVLCGD